MSEFKLQEPAKNNPELLAKQLLLILNFSVIIWGAADKRR